MHETGIHRFGYVQVRVPCRQAHFYHLRHSYKNIGVDEWKIDMENLASILNKYKIFLEILFPIVNFLANGNPDWIQHIL